eukprot:364197-Chlamydomonas_euryale.AAC.28
MSVIWRQKMWKLLRANGQCESISNSVCVHHAQCNNIDLVPPNFLKFDFLGKDSIRYENTVEVHEKVYAAVEKFRKMDQHGKKKEPGDLLFDGFDATALNKELKSIMDGLSVKVWEGEQRQGANSMTGLGPRSHEMG